MGCANGTVITGMILSWLKTTGTYCARSQAGMLQYNFGIASFLSKPADGLTRLMVGCNYTYIRRQPAGDVQQRGSVSVQLHMLEGEDGYNMSAYLQVSVPVIWL
jgi:hypothetical protein